MVQMMSHRKRRLDLRRIKSLRNYTIAEASRLLSVHRRTVREWIKQGLPTVDERRPILIHGTDLKAFLANRRHRRKRPCAEGELFCVKCKLPRRPTAGTMTFIPMSPTRGSLIGICPTCSTAMTRWASLTQSEELKAKHVGKITTAQSRISDSPGPVVICHLEAS